MKKLFLTGAIAIGLFTSSAHASELDGNKLLDCTSRMY